MNTDELDNMNGNKPSYRITSKTIKLPKDRDKLISFTYLSTHIENEEEQNGSDGKIKIDKIAVNYSILNNLPNGK